MSQTPLISDADCLSGSLCGAFFHLAAVLSAVSMCLGVAKPRCRDKSLGEWPRYQVFIDPQLPAMFWCVQYVGGV